MQALILDSHLRTANVSKVPYPELLQHELTVKVCAVGLNPVDALYTFQPLASSSTNQIHSRIVGSDFAGIVVETGADVPDIVKVGHRVAGFLQGASSVNFRPGAFAEFVTIPYDLIWKLSDGVSFEDASSISLCGLTAAFALFGEKRLGLTAPWDIMPEVTAGLEHNQDVQGVKRRTLLIYGASTTVGIFAAQLLQHTTEKFELLGLASPKHFQWLKDPPYAYNHLIDYRSDWFDEVRKVQAGKLIDLAFDCISEGSTVQTICQLMHPNGRLAVVRSQEGGAWKLTDVTSVVPSYGAVWEGLGEDVMYKGMNLPANTDARAFAVKFYGWLSSNPGATLKPHSVRVMPGGLESIVGDGFQLLGSGLMTDRAVDREESWMQAIAAEKLVYRISSDTSTEPQYRKLSDGVSELAVTSHVAGIARSSGIAENPSE